MADPASESTEPSKPEPAQVAGHAVVGWTPACDSLLQNSWSGGEHPNLSNHLLSHVAAAEASLHLLVDRIHLGAHSLSWRHLTRWHCTLLFSTLRAQTSCV